MMCSSPFLNSHIQLHFPAELGLLLQPRPEGSDLLLYLFPLSQALPNLLISQ